MNFCTATIRTDPGLLADQGVLSRQALTITADAVLAAERIVEQARADADEVTWQADQAAQASVAELQSQTLAQAETMFAALEQLQQVFLERSEDMVVDLAQALFLRLAGELTPRERAALMLRQLLAAAPPRLVEPVLRLHPSEAALIEPDSLPAGWILKADPAMGLQRCRLEAVSGEWAFDFDAAVLALRQGLDGARSQQGEMAKAAVEQQRRELEEGGQDAYPEDEYGQDEYDQEEQEPRLH